MNMYSGYTRLIVILNIYIICRVSLTKYTPPQSLDLSMEFIPFVISLVKRVHHYYFYFVLIFFTLILSVNTERIFLSVKSVGN
jgi:hypothetical protein